jgi:hypothetical protein
MIIIFLVNLLTKLIILDIMCLYNHQFNKKNLFYLINIFDQVFFIKDNCIRLLILMKELEEGFLYAFFIIYDY